MKLLEENQTYKLAKLVEEKPFLALNATHMSEILSFLCNELLSNKAVVNQIEVTMENVHVMKRKRLALETKVKKLRILHNRKFKYKADVGRFLEENSTNASRNSNTPDPECQSEGGEDKEDSMSVMSDSTRFSENNGSETPTRGFKGKNKGKKNIKKGKRKLDEENYEDMQDDENNSDLDTPDVDEEKEEDVSACI